MGDRLLGAQPLKRLAHDRLSSAETAAGTHLEFWVPWRREGIKNQPACRADSELRPDRRALGLRSVRLEVPGIDGTIGRTKFLEWGVQG
jgi:hypothetical protein